MRQSEKTTELMASLAEIQFELPTMPKDSQAYGYKYTDLDTIVKTIKPILHKHNIGYMQSVGSTVDGAQTLTTRVFNNQGQYLEDTTVLPVISGTKNNSAQTLGMSITYMRRYALCAMLGITCDEDVDSNTVAQQAQAQTRAQAKAEPPKKPEPKKAAKFDFEPKGGETTPEEKKEIGALLTSKKADGKPVFSKDEVKAYSDMRKDFTAGQVIAMIKKELQIRMTPAQDLPPAVEAIKNAVDGEVVQGDIF
jgi:hypothetical protein